MNYQSNKTELVNQVQMSLDKAVEAYYAQMAQKHVVTVVTDDNDSTFVKKSNDIHKMVKHLDSDTIVEYNEYNESGMIRIERSITSDSINQFFSWEFSDTIEGNGADSLEIKMLASKIFVAMREDFIGSPKLAKILEEDFKNKQWPIEFGLLTINNDCNKKLFPCDSVKSFGITKAEDQLVAKSQSVFLPRNTQLEIHFSNITSILLKGSLISILLSLLLSGAIIFCLLYLFQTIRQQKQLAEIKDDLISNITHEFKTPITTVQAALEGILNFNAQNDSEKTKKYVDISNQQLVKLNVMVEKLLETASLDSDNLSLRFEQVNLVELIQSQLEKYSLDSNKDISFNSSSNQIVRNVDVFHFESVVQNLIDNALKYGGNKIELQLNENETEGISIVIRDNGNPIPKELRSKIFEKFYRIPTGNIHNIKGFGIGLYYANSIVKKHDGTLLLLEEKGHNSFKISLPNAN